MNFGPYPEKREIPFFVQKQSGEELALKLLRQHDALDALHRKEISDVQKRADRLAEQLALLVHKKRFTENDPFVMSLRQLLKNEGITLRTYVGEEVTDVLEDEADIVEWLPPGEDTVDRVEDALEPEIHWQGNLLHRAKLSCRQAAEDATEEEESASAEMTEEDATMQSPEEAVLEATEAEAVKAPEEAVLEAPEAEAAEESVAEEQEEMAEEAAEAAKEAAEQNQIPSSDGLSEDADQEAASVGGSDTSGGPEDSEYPDKEEYSGDEYFDDEKYYDDEEDPEDDEYSEDDEFFDEEEYLDDAGKPDDEEDSDQDPDQSGFFSKTLDRIRRWLNGE